MKKDYYDNWLDYLDDEEKRVYEEVLEWENRPQRTLNPLRWISLSCSSQLVKLPPEYAAPVINTFGKVLTVLRDTAMSTINTDSIAYKVSLKCGKAIESGVKDEHLPINILDEASRECIAFNIGTSTVEGALCGAGGIHGIIIDIPILYTFLYRLIGEVALCYGYDLTSMEERMYVMKVLELGHQTDDSVRQGTIAELHVLHTAVRGGISPNFLTGKAAIQSMNALCERIGLSYARRKLVTILAVVGGVTGAAANYLLAREVGQAAYHTYRKRFIMDRAMARRLNRL